MKIAAIIGIVLSLLALLFFFGVLWTVLLVILYIILGIIALILLLLLIVLFCRIDYHIDFKKTGKDASFEYSAAIIWLWGGFNKKFTPKPKNKKSVKKSSTATKEDGDGNEDGEKKKKENREKKGFGQTLKEMDFDKLKVILGYTLVLIKEIFAVVRPKFCRIRGRFGAQEPDITGMAIAFIGVVATQLNIDAHVEGDFEESVLIFDIKIAGCMRLWSILLPAMRYILKPEIRRPLFKMIFRRKGKKSGHIKNKNKRKDEQNGNRVKQ